MKKHVITSLLYTSITAVLLGIVYPLAVTGLARVLFPRQAAGSLLRNSSGTVIGSSLIGQPFSGSQYFHSRPSNAGTGYDAAASSGSNLGPTNRALLDRVQASVTTEQAGNPVPVDLVTASGSGLDPDISPEAAYYQAARVAAHRHLSQAAVNALVEQNLTGRQLGLLGEPRVNVLALNLALDKLAPLQ